MEHKLLTEPSGHDWDIERAIRWTLGDIGIINDRTVEEIH